MAHEGIVALLIILGLILIISYQLGPSREVREVKRLEAKAMTLPSAVLLFILAAILFSGILG
ncbi:MAG: hypothetical protein ACXABV_20395 [Candidatus Thorarchaeota archaeon]|jgi:hypothetical protein